MNYFFRIKNSQTTRKGKENPIVTTYINKKNQPIGSNDADTPQHLNGIPIKTV